MSEPPRISTRVDDAGPGRLEIDAAELRLVAGPDKGTRHPLGCDSILIGSGSDCDLVLHDPTVSSHHAHILAHSAGYSLRDLGSKNGVRVGGFPVERVPLVDGLQLRLGHSAIAVHALGGHRSYALAKAGTVDGLVAHSVKMRAVVAALRGFAANEVSVLIEGETGTGKELAAQLLHRWSPRAGGPFVIFDCSAVAPTLAAAELFGHVRGAFSGADVERIGLFEEADSGTLFLDEIGELPSELQPLLLRAIERKRFRRVGDSTERQADVRVVAATNRTLTEEVRCGRFRKDLYFRLAVATVRVPPLRERAEDIGPLAQHFATELGTGLSPEMLTLFTSYEWPGNVRELRNAVARLAARPNDVAGLFEGPAHDPLFSGAQLRNLAEARRLANDAFERRYLEEVVSRADGSISRAAEIAGVSRQLMTRLAAKHQLRVRDRAGE
jgi:DNA-binding NtrC family response regulator